MTFFYPIILSLLAGHAAQVAASCAYGTHLHPRAENGVVEVNSFGYVGQIGPLNWAALAPENSLCATGTRQSPINMASGVFAPVPASSVGLTIPNMEAGAEFENLGTTVEVVAEGGSMSIGGIAYELQQFHFHLPSEHLDNGTSHAMEMHMVFQGQGTHVGVIGVYIDQGAEDTSLLATVFDSLDAITTPGTKTTTAPLDMSELAALITAGDLQAYVGSLTTPPCSEGVQWLVSTQSLSITPTTFARVRDVIGFNSRFPQNTPGLTNVLQLGVATARVAVAHPLTV